MNRRNFIKSGLIYVPWLVLPHDLVNASAFLPVPTLNDNTYRWAYQRVPSASSSISAATLMKADRLMSGLIKYSLVSRIVRMNLMVGRTLNALKQPFITNNSAVEEVITNFVAGDYSEATGLTGDGSTKSMLCKVDLAGATFGDNDLAMAVYVRNGTNEAKVCIGVQQSPNDTTLMPSNGGVTYWDSNNAATGRISAVDVNGTGYYLGSRSSSSSSVLYKNGISTASTSNAGGSRSSVGPQVGVFCIYDSGVGQAALTTRNLSHYAVMLGLDATQAANMSRLVIQFETAMGRNV
jgi:hypothetical protein